jgi:putative OPT family oligopeptide transporter
MTPKPYRPFVPEDTKMQEFTMRAVLLGLVLTVVLGAANAYLGLRAGQTIAATYPAAVISMAALRLRGGTILEENLARTAGSIGESIAAGAIFTIPAFVISRAWPSFDFEHAYWRSTALMMMGGILGVLFVSLVRRVMVEDPELPFPESLAAAEIHKAGQRGGEAAKYLFYNMAFGGVSFLLGAFNLYAQDRDFFFRMGDLGRSFVRLGAGAGANTLPVGGVSKFAAPSVSPAYIGVGYVIGPQLASLNVAGSVLAWGLLVPLLIYFLGPDIQKYVPATGPAGTEVAWDGLANGVWRFFVRPIAVGGMMVGAAYTLFRMRKSLGVGLGKAFAEVRGIRPPMAAIGRLERYMSSKTVFAGIAAIFVLMAVLYVNLSNSLGGGIAAAVVMLVTGFFFATVSGYLVGVIGSSNNPISGLTLSTLIIAAVLMVSLGVSGSSGVIAVLGVASVVCVSSAVAGELLQDFKVGYILGGTPRTIQIVEIIAVVCASLVMYFPLMILHEGNKNMGGIGFGDPKLPAPQAGLMASLAQGIVGGEMAWPLIGVGVMLGIAMILIQVRSPMLVAIGMYLPLATTFAIFIGGMIRWLTDELAERKGFNQAQRARVENVGILIASGFIAGEALVGLVTAWLNYKYGKLPEIIKDPSYLVGLGVMFLLALVMVKVPLNNAGSPDEPAPPTAIM